MMRILALSILWILLASGLVGTASAERETLRLEGSTTTYAVARRLAKDFRRLNPEVEVIVSGGGSEAGLSALLAGKADIANSSRFISHEELSLAFREGIYPVPFRIADDCILPIVHTSNRIRDLSLDQLRGIFSGRISNWRELGGADQPIEVISRDSHSGTYGVWRDLVMRGEPVVTTQPLQSSSEAVVRAVSRTRGAIGYIGLGNLVAGIKPLSVSGVMGSTSTVADGSYPIQRPLFMFTRGWPEGPILQFINYATDPHGGQSIIEKMGFVSVYKHKHSH